MSLDKRLESLEKAVTQLKQDQQQYSALKTLAQKSPNLLNVDNLIQAYKKKAKELLVNLASNKSLIKQARQSLSTYDSRVKAQVQAATQKRDRTTKFLDTRIGNLQNSFKQLGIDNQTMLKSIQVRIKQEVQHGVQHIDSQLDAYKRDSNQKIRSTKQEVKQYQNRLSQASNQIKQNLFDYDQTRASRIQKMQAQGRGNDPSSQQGRRNLTNWLIEEVSANLSKETANIRASYEARFKALSLKYNQSLLSIRADVEQARRTLNQESKQSINKPESQLAATLEQVRQKMNQLASYSSKALDQVLESVKIHNQKVEEIGENTKKPDQILAFREKVAESRNLLTRIDDKVHSDFFVLSKLLKQAETLCKSIKDKRQTVRVKMLETESEMSRNGIKEKLDEIKAMLDSLETKVIMLARQVSKTFKEEIVNEEVKQEEKRSEKEELEESEQQIDQEDDTL